MPDRSGTWELGISSAGQARLFLEDRLLAVNTQPDVYYRQGSTELTARVDLEAGSTYRLAAEFSVDSGIEMAGLRIGARPLPPADAPQRAVQAASRADVAVVLVGYDGAWESEGADRPHMDLPGEQDDLVRAVAAANPRTVVVVNAGAPVTMPWADDVAAYFVKALDLDAATNRRFDLGGPDQVTWDELYARLRRTFRRKGRGDGQVGRQ